MNQRAKEILELEIEALKNLTLNNLDEVVNEILNCQGKVVFTSMGKSGAISKKIASTFSSTGTPSLFMHPGEAAHGDLGILSSNDLIIAMSNSGKTKELVLTLELSRKLFPNIKIIGICGSKESDMCKYCDLVLEIGTIKEPCPFGLAPTASTTVMAVVGDIIAIILMESKNFSKEEYGKRHHGGYIGTLIGSGKANE